MLDATSISWGTFKITPMARSWTNCNGWLILRITNLIYERKRASLTRQIYICLHTLTSSPLTERLWQVAKARRSSLTERKLQWKWVCDFGNCRDSGSKWTYQHNPIRQHHHDHNVKTSFPAGIPYYLEHFSPLKKKKRSTWILNQDTAFIYSKRERRKIESQESHPWMRVYLGQVGWPLGPLLSPAQWGVVTDSDVV